MEVGQLNKRVELINCGRVKTAAGGFTRADTVEATVWAHVATPSWSQTQRAERRQQSISHVITIRYNPQLVRTFGPEARARYRDHAGVTRELSIKTAIDPQDGTPQRGTWLELGCEEGGPT